MQRSSPTGLPKAPRAGMWPVQILRREAVAPDSVSIYLVRPGTRQAPAAYRPGQYITLAIPIGHDTVYRSYALQGDGNPHRPWIITMKRQQLYGISTPLSQRIQEGGLIFASVPQDAERPEETLSKKKVSSQTMEATRDTDPHRRSVPERADQPTMGVTAKRSAVALPAEGPGADRSELATIRRMVLLAFLVLFLIVLWAFIAHFSVSSVSPAELKALARISGIVSYVLFTFSLFCGLLRVYARRMQEPISWTIDEMHQFFALLGWLVVVAHIIVILINPLLPFTIFNIVQPFIEPAHRPAASWAVIAMYMATIVAVSSWLKQRLSFALWRGLHFLSYVVFIAMTVHGWLAGTDTNTPWMNAIYGGSVAGVVFLSAVRFFISPGTKAPVISR